MEKDRHGGGGGKERREKVQNKKLRESEMER